MVNWWARGIPLLVLAAAACGSSEDPPNPAACTADNDEPVVVKSNPESEAAEFLGLRVGARWTYDTTDYNEPKPKATMVTKEITGCETIMVVDCEERVAYEYFTYVQKTTGGSAGDKDSHRSYLAALPEGVVIVRKAVVDNDELDQVITYAPHFMRLFEGPYEVGREETYRHARFELEADDETLRALTHRGYSHVVAAIDEQVDVALGSYDNALHMQRTEIARDEDTKGFWYVRGVGKVYETAYDAGGGQTQGEELVAFEEGSDTCD